MSRNSIATAESFGPPPFAEAVEPAGQWAWIPGPLPGLNELIAAAKQRGRGMSRWNGYAALKARWEAQVMRSVRAQGVRPVPSGRRVHLWFIWREPTRRRDPDNVAAGGRKLILDALVRLGILPTDGWTTVAGWTDRFAIHRQPGVRLGIIPYRDGQDRFGARGRPAGESGRQPATR